MKRFLIPMLLLLPLTVAHAQNSDNYKPINPNVTLESSTLPVLTVTTGRQTIDRQQAINVSINLKTNGNTALKPAEGEAALTYWGDEAFTHQAKKSFQIITADGTQRLLIALYSDRSFIRAQLTNTLAQTTIKGLPPTSHCELIIDGVYYGLYLLMETPKTVSTDMTDYLIAAELAHDADCYRFNIGQEDADNQTVSLSLLNTYLGYGNNYAAEGYRTDSWIYQENKLLQAQDDPWRVPDVWTRLTNDADFKSQMRQRWQQLRTTAYSDDRINHVVDSLSRQLLTSGAIQRDSQAWPVWGRRLWPNHHVATSFDDEILALRQWLTERLAWIDTRMTAAEVITRREPLTISCGLNADVIAEALPASAHVNADLDDNGFVFYSEDCRQEGGMPADGIIHSDKTGIDYQLADYDADNILRLATQGTEGTLTLTSPTAMNRLFIVAMAGNGSGSYTLTINYTDGTNDQQNLYAPDWGENDGIIACYRMHATDDSVSPYNEWSLFEDSVDVDNNKTVKSLSFTSTSSLTWDGYQPVVSIFALAAQTEHIVSSIRNTTTEAGETTATTCYDINGRQLSEPRKGVNIVVERTNGQTRRKVVIINR